MSFISYNYQGAELIFNSDKVIKIEDDQNNQDESIIYLEEGSMLHINKKELPEVKKRLGIGPTGGFTKAN